MSEGREGSFGAEGGVFKGRVRLREERETTSLREEGVTETRRLSVWSWRSQKQFSEEMKDS